MSAGPASVAPRQLSRAMRLGLVQISRAPMAAATARTEAKRRVGAPAIHSSPKRIAVRITAVPMSPPSMIRPSRMKAAGTSGTSRCFHWASSRRSCLRARRSAPQSTRASLPNSLGWIWKGPPSEIQLVLPLISWPIPGTWTRAISATEPTMIG